MQDLAITARGFFSGLSRKTKLFLLCGGLIATLVLFYAFPARACAPCDCVAVNHAITRGVVLTEHILTRIHIRTQFERHRQEFIVYYFFKEHVLAAMMLMTEQLVSSAMNQMLIVGAFFDAKQQLETQQLFQRLAAQASKDYHPSHEMCEIGTLSRSLASAQRRGEYNAYFLSQQMQDRQMRTYSVGSAAGKGYEVVNRWNDFKDSFCNRNDNDGKLGPKTDDPICGGVALANRNEDVDYTRTIEHPLTIDVNFSTAAASAHRDGIIGLANNLYGNDVFAYFPEAFFKNPDNEDEYMYVRSIVAKRSVAMNSFNNIVGMKSMGQEQAAQVAPYMNRLLEQLGVSSAADRAAMVRERPSYYAGMEMLTKRLYQRPEFYTSLYDKPVNVERKRAAMRAIGLMQNMDLFKSKLRSEAALAVLTEIEIFKAQEAMQSRLTGTKETGIQ